jgi:hypothetical protein
VGKHMVIVNCASHAIVGRVNADGDSKLCDEEDCEKEK